MIAWAGRIIVFFGAAHTLLALTFEGGARYADEWFSGALWGADLSAMSPAGSAYWLTLCSFGPPFIVLGLTVLWLDRRGIVPPVFIGWSLAGWAVVDGAVTLTTPWPLILLAAALLLIGARRTAGRGGSRGGATAGLLPEKAGS